MIVCDHLRAFDKTPVICWALCCFCMAWVFLLVWHVRKPWLPPFAMVSVYVFACRRRCLYVPAEVATPQLQLLCGPARLGAALRGHTGCGGTFTLKLPASQPGTSAGDLI